MDEARYVFIQDVKERKRNAWGNNNKVRGGGKKVKMPSDYLTKREVKKLSGEVTTYEMDKPVSWQEYKSWPKEIRLEYQNGLVTKYGATAKSVGVMMGVSERTIAVERQAIGVKVGVGHRLDKVKWAEFTGNTGEEKETGQPDLLSIITALQGTGAKLTIEVRL